MSQSFYMNMLTFFLKVSIRTTSEHTLEQFLHGEKTRRKTG